MAKKKFVTFTDKELQSIYYYDLGPDEIDVSSYPQRQKDQYALFAKTCSQCHTLARAINSPHVGRGAWEIYVLRMRLRSQFKGGTAITRKEAKAILNFLAYDAKVRKVSGKAEFKSLTRRLRKRFDETVDERMRRLHEANPERFRE